MQSAFNIRPTFAAASRPTTVKHLPHSGLHLGRPETTICAPQIVAHLRAASVNSLQTITITLSSQPLRYYDGSPRCVPYNCRSNANALVELVSAFVRSMRIISCPEVTTVEASTSSRVQNTLHLSTKLYREMAHLQDVVVHIHIIASLQMVLWKQKCAPRVVL
jgi:hypothetical protein